MEFSLAKDIYSKEAILQTIYLFKEDFNIELDTNESSIIVKVDSKKSVIFDKEKFMNLLLEQQLREMLNQKNGSLRDIIYKKAFSLVE